MVRIMSSEPHEPRIDATTGYYFTRWYANGRRMGKTFGHKSKVSAREARRAFTNWMIQRSFAGPSSGNPLASVIAGYNKYAASYYRHPGGDQTGEHINIYHALKPLEGLFGKLDASAFRPSHIDAYVQAQVEAGIARTTINKRIGIIRRMFKWAVRNEYVKQEVYGLLLTVGSIGAGRTKAKETGKVQPVTLRHMVATMKHVPPVIANMIRLQWLTGMRPGEVCNLVPAHIDRTRKTWLYLPPRHKTAHREKLRVIAFGPKARDLLAPYLFRGDHEPCFTPQESRKWWNAQRRQNSKANRPTESLKAGYNLRPKFDAKTYADAIERGCNKAGVPVWTPNRIRHTSASQTSHREGRDAAQRLLGHANVKTTAIYITEDIRKLMELAERVG